MKVFVAGGSGALGQPLIRQLLRAGQEVVGLTRNRPELIAGLGATPAVANAFDAEELAAVVKEASPDAVVHALTRIPHTPLVTPGRLRENDRLRIDGTRNLLSAAQAVGARRLVSESITFAFKGRSEDKMKPLEGQGPFQRSVNAAVSLEAQTREFGGIVLRYGYFYGPRTSITDELPRLLRRRMLPVIGRGTAWWSFIHVEDAASATIAALNSGKPGETYNVCDDEPILAVEALRYIAQVSRARRPFHLPNVGPAFVRFYFNEQTGANNDKAKRELGWTPRFPSLKEGFVAQTSDS
jgi:nucleoside-diphosphate-sugar epimerase